MLKYSNGKYFYSGGAFEINGQWYSVNRVAELLYLDFYTVYAYESGDVSQVETPNTVELDASES